MDEQRKADRDAFRAFALVAYIVGVFVLLFSFWLGRLSKGAPEPVVVEHTDTVRAPPDPDFIEAFRLDCRWIPRGHK